MELLIIPLFIWAIKLFVRVVQFLFRVVCYILGCISLGIDTARSRSERKRTDEIKRAELEWKKQLEQAKQEQREQDRIARIERERRKEERAEIEWQWKVQKEADRRAELEWKRKRREQIEKEKESGSKKAEAKRQAQEDLDHFRIKCNNLQRLYNEYENDFNIAKERGDTKKARTAYRRMIGLDDNMRVARRNMDKAYFTLNNCGA